MKVPNYLDTTSLYHPLTSAYFCAIILKIVILKERHVGFV